MADQIPEFTCNNWGVGNELIAYVDCDKDYANHDELLGPVLIEGKRYVCKGIDFNNLNDRIGMQLFKGERIGLLIDKV
jgi:hypothetical protein